MRQLLFLVTLAYPVLAQQASTPGNADWSKPFPPLRVVGNLYYVGTYDLASYLITTPQGHILINTGLSDSVPIILANVEALGFKFSDIKILLATHGHFDHAAGLAEIKRLTGAKMMVEEGDVSVLESGGKTDFRWGKDLNARFEPVKVDRALKDGEQVTWAGTTLTVHHHPGHSKGASSFSLNVAEAGKTYRVLIANMGSINPGVRVSGMPQYPQITDDYARTFHDQKELKIDIWLASHASQFHLHDKYKPGDAYDPNRFVDPQGYLRSVEELEKVYRDQLARERAEGKK
ncbi:MAG: subclass B3 metallo-beta-lactamase [Bryobacteraceae bacterium]|jgi:metallo-beta-lactamase class B